MGEFILTTDHQMNLIGKMTSTYSQRSKCLVYLTARYQQLTQGPADLVHFIEKKEIQLHAASKFNSKSVELRKIKQNLTVEQHELSERAVLEIDTVKTHFDGTIIPQLQKIEVKLSEIMEYGKEVSADVDDRVWFIENYQSLVDVLSQANDAQLNM